MKTKRQEQNYPINGLTKRSILGWGHQTDPLRFPELSRNYSAVHVVVPTILGSIPRPPADEKLPFPVGRPSRLESSSPPPPSLSLPSLPNRCIIHPIVFHSAMPDGLHQPARWGTSFITTDGRYSSIKRGGKKLAECKVPGEYAFLPAPADPLDYSPTWPR